MNYYKQSLEAGKDPTVQRLEDEIADLKSRIRELENALEWAKTRNKEPVFFKCDKEDVPSARFNFDKSLKE